MVNNAIATYKLYSHYIFVLLLVPCFKRYKDVESMKFHEYLIDENDGEGGWVDTHYFNDAKEADEEVTVGEEAKEMDIFAQTKPTVAVDDDGDDSEAEDIESFMNEGLDDENDEVSFSLSCSSFKINFFCIVRLRLISPRFPRT